jgi:hypothetical protein
MQGVPDGTYDAVRQETTGTGLTSTPMARPACKLKIMEKQLQPSTFTALGIGPIPEYKIDLLIKDLKLL